MLIMIANENAFCPSAFGKQYQTILLPVPPVAKLKPTIRPRANYILHM